MSAELSESQEESIPTKINRQQDEVLERLDELNEQILELLAEFNARLSSDDSDSAPHQAAA